MENGEEEGEKLTYMVEWRRKTRLNEEEGRSELEFLEEYEVVAMEESKTWKEKKKSEPASETRFHFGSFLL